MNSFKRFFMLVLIAAFSVVCFAQTETKVLDWYFLPGPIIAMTSGSTSSRVTVEAAIGYEKENEAALEALVQNKSKMVSFLRSLIFSKTVKELGPNNREALNKEIIDGMNAKLFSDPIVLDIKFIQFEIE